MPEVLRRYSLRKREKKLLLQEISDKLKTDAEEVFGSKPQIEVIETARHNIFLVKGLPVLGKYKEDLFPTLAFKDFLPLLPKIIVNMGAVPHVCNGADIMAPGIVEIQGDFKENDLVIVLDERNRKTIAIARSIVGSDSAKTLKKGRIFKNLHHVGDDIWAIIKPS
jgi:PUA domain protein